MRLNGMENGLIFYFGKLWCATTRKCTYTSCCGEQAVRICDLLLFLKMSGTLSDPTSDEGFDEPAYATDEKSKASFLRTIVAVKGLKSTSSVTLKGIKKKASNADIESTFEQESFCLRIQGTKGDMKHKKYQLKIKKLPGEIIPERSYIEPEKDRVLVFLNKKEDKSWYPELENGLETAEEDVE